MKQAELFECLARIHADRAVFDANIAQALVAAAEVMEPRVAPGVLVPLHVLGPLDSRGHGNVEIIVKPGESTCLYSEVVSYADCTLRGFTIVSDVPLATSVQVRDLRIGGGINLLLADDWVIAEAFRRSVAKLRVEPEVRAPNRVEICVRNTGKKDAKFAIILSCEVTKDAVAQWPAAAKPTDWVGKTTVPSATEPYSGTWPTK